MRTFGTLHAVDGEFAAHVEPHVAVRLKRIFPRASQNRQGAIVLRSTPEVAKELDWVMDRWPLVMEDATHVELRRLVDDQRARDEAIERILEGAGGLTAGLSREPSLPAREYQLTAADLCLATGQLLLGDQLGLGKTLSGMLTFRHPEALPALVVAPTHLTRQWQTELGKFFPLLTAHIIRKGTPYDISARREMRGYEPDVLITTYAKLAGWADHLAGKVRTVVFDEIHELRRHESLKYKAAGRVADEARFRMGLSATPVMNYAGEAFNIMSILDPDALGTRAEFVREWGSIDSSGNVLVKDPRALGTYLREQGLFLKRTRKEVGRELPPLTEVTHYVEADREPLADVQEALEDLAHRVLESLDHKDRYVAGGQLSWKLRKATGVAKAPHVADFARLTLQSENKVVLWVWHREVYDILEERLADFNPVIYSGSESPAQKEESRRRFIEDDDCRVFLMSLRSGAGLNGLQTVCSFGAFAELDWSPGMHKQCGGRLNREGVDDTGATLVYLVSSSGSDPVVAEALGIKEAQAAGIDDPTGELFEVKSDEGEHRVRRLANEVLGR